LIFKEIIPSYLESFINDGQFLGEKGVSGAAYKRNFVSERERGSKNIVFT